MIIEGMTIAVTAMEKMVNFYSGVFGVEFKEIDQFNAKLYATELWGLKVLFCPAEVARNTATQNRHQFDFVVADLDALVEKVQQFGGQIMGPITEAGDFRSVGIYDPDSNSMVFKQPVN